MKTIISVNYPYQVRIIICFVLAVFLLFSHQSFAQYQINGASTSDYQVYTTFSMPTSNTGIAVAPDNSGELQFVAHVYDDSGLNYHWIKWYDLSGNVLDSMMQYTSDPDVAYLYNPDLLAVVSCDRTPPAYIWLDVFALNGSPTPYYYRNGTSGPDGVYPNIDINTYGHGIVCFEDSNDIYVVIPILSYTSPGFESAIYAGNGIQPDVVVLDDSNKAVLTYIDGGDLIIKEFSYQDLLGGSFNVTSTHTYSGSTYAYPRVAGPRNAAFVNRLNMWSVVAERDSNRIAGFTYEGNTVVGPYTVDTGLVNCPSKRPVVTYTENKIVFAWAEDYSTCSQRNSMDNTIKTDVLLREYDPRYVTLLNSGDFYEINRKQGSFHNSNTAITCLYDGNYPLNGSGEGMDVVSYNNSDSIFWKARTFGNNYKRANPYQSIKRTVSTEFNIQLVENPVHNNLIRLMNVSEIGIMDITVHNSLGQQINIDKRTSKENNEITIDATGLKKGMYFINYKTDNSSATIKAIIE